MQFGLFGGARTKRSVGLEDSQGYESFIEYVTEADRLDFKHLFMVEHHFTGQGQVSASMTVLAYLAARTRHIRLGTAVVVLPWHNPVLIAEQAATLDLLSGGRVDFGVGRGYRQAEFDGFCIPIAEATERFDEAMEIIRKAWTTPHDKNGGRFSHHGKRWHYDNILNLCSALTRRCGSPPAATTASGAPPAKATTCCSISLPRPTRSSSASRSSARNARRSVAATIG
jgi:alkanesulfonate monooxygenase SsuD/methylene tetrahydromethanopterin reductase-like flavin-dependent oxidoreductase (luciferase family)